MAKAKKVTPRLDGAEMTADGLLYNGFIMSQVVEKCDGCDRVVALDEGKYCTSYAEPERKWAKKACNFATHVRLSLDSAGKVKVNPLKASKRAAKGKK